MASAAMSPPTPAPMMATSMLRIFSYPTATSSPRLGAHQRGEVPLVAERVVAQDEGAPVVGLYLEIAMARLEPAVEDLEHREARLAEHEAARLLFAAVARIALDAQLQSGGDDEVEGAGAPLFHLHHELRPKQAITLVAWLVREIELAGEHASARRLHLDVDVSRAAGIFRRHDGLEAVAALGVGELVTAVAVAAVVVFAGLVGVPEVEQCARYRLAVAREHLAAHYEARRLRSRLGQRDALRRLRLEERALGLPRRDLAAGERPGLPECSRRDRPKNCCSDEAAAGDHVGS